MLNEPNAYRFIFKSCRKKYQAWFQAGRKTLKIKWKLDA